MDREPFIQNMWILWNTRRDLIQPHTAFVPDELEIVKNPATTETEATSNSAEIEAIKQQVYQQENKGLKKPFEVLVSVKETSEQRGEVFTSKVCLN